MDMCLTLEYCCSRILLLKFDKLFWNLGPCILILHREYLVWCIVVYMPSWGPDLVNKLILYYTIQGRSWGLIVCTP
jgi:hypothetical protein